MTNIESTIEDLLAELGAPSKETRLEWCLGMAKAYIDAGFAVTPIKVAIEPATRPRVKWNKGRKAFTVFDDFAADFRARTDRRDGYLWWIGIATGAQPDDDTEAERIYIIDVDVKSGDGWNTLTGLLDAAGHDLTDLTTLQARTPSGGAHYYFKAKAKYGDLGRRIEPWPHVDFLGDDGFAGCFPCPDYEIVNCAPIKPLPDYLTPRQEVTPAPSARSGSVRGIENDVLEMHPIRRAFNEAFPLAELLEDLGYVFLEEKPDGERRYNPPDRSMSKADDASAYLRPPAEGHEFPTFKTFHSSVDPYYNMSGADSFAMYCASIGIVESLDDTRTQAGRKRCIDAAQKKLRENVDTTALLQYLPNGNVKNSVENCTLLLREYESEHERISTDSFTGDVTYDVERVAFDFVCWVERKTTLAISYPTFAFGTAERAIEQLGVENSHDTLQEYMADLPQWDGNDHIKALAKQICVKPDELQETFLRKWLVAACARALKAEGFSFDAILILQGRQGIGKSRLLRNGLCPNPHWFSDDVGSQIVSGYGRRDELSKLRGKWLVEFAELSAFQGARDQVQRNNDIKAFLTTSTDEYREAYARRKIRVPRRCVFAGTTNEFSFLNDPSGSRRYWVVSVKEIDVERVAAMREQLWSQALHLYKSGLVMPYLTKEEQAALEKRNALYREDNELAEELSEYLQGASCVKISNIMIERYKVSANDVSMAQYKPMEKDIKLALRSMGWQSKMVRVNNQTVRRWCNPDEALHAQCVERLKNADKDCYTKLLTHERYN